MVKIAHFWNLSCKNYFKTTFIVKFRLKLVFRSEKLEMGQPPNSSQLEMVCGTVFGLIVGTDSPSRPGSCRNSNCQPRTGWY